MLVHRHPTFWNKLKTSLRNYLNCVHNCADHSLLDFKIRSSIYETFHIYHFKLKTGWESQLAGGKPVGYIQAQPRSWAKYYLEQIQLVVRAGLELGISRFQVRHLDHSVTLPPSKWASEIHTQRKAWRTNDVILVLSIDFCVLWLSHMRI